ncbi:cupin domain-containing protein [Hymenobacter norwichensis]|uniref:cupin domain-containing protein n=1 Tax=Hymenobacter norwichensis TaxID=223903 RepID=UPI0003B791E8|nr:cupin domain-containing protein [Hymenobacter norwichensis]
MALFDYEGVEPAGPSLHKHLTQDETFYVVAGEFLFQVGAQKHLLHAGDTIFLPRQVAHTWVQRSARGRLLCWVQPAGNLEEFFVFMSQQTTPLSPGQVQQVHARYGMERLGPGLSPTLDYALSPGLDTGFVTAAGAGRRDEHTRLHGRNANDLKIAGSDTGGTFSLFEYTGNEQGGPPLHVHPHQDEVFYVLEGRYRFRVGTTEHELTAGDLIFLPRAVPHTFAQLTATGRLLFSFQPTGRMEEFFRALAAQPAPPTPAVGAQLFAAHDMQVVGPPLTVDR